MLKRILFPVLFLFVFGSLGAQANYDTVYSDTIGTSSVIIDTVWVDSLVVGFNDSLHIYGYSNFSTSKITYKSDSIPNFDSVAIILVDSLNGGEYAHPFNGIITSHFGYRRYRQHYGTDVDLITGDSVLAAFDGKVRITKYSRGFGKVVVIRHPNGLETVYAHLSKFLVDSNQYIHAGQVIALGGNTGRSTGSHLHFEVRFLGRALDPESIIDFKNYKLLANNIMITEGSFGYLSRIAADKNAKFHYVKSGDTLSAIARRYHSRVSKLCYYNGINQNAILQIGQRLRVR